jgi:hypothetical protein
MAAAFWRSGGWEVSPSFASAFDYLSPVSALLASEHLLPMLHPQILRPPLNPGVAEAQTCSCPCPAQDPLQQT